MPENSTNLTICVRESGKLSSCEPFKIYLWKRVYRKRSSHFIPKWECPYPPETFQNITRILVNTLGKVRSDLYSKDYLFSGKSAKYLKGSQTVSNISIKNCSYLIWVLTLCSVKRKISHKIKFLCKRFYNRANQITFSPPMCSKL